MAKTYTKLVFHIVFSTRERAPLITGQIREPLYHYIGGVIRSEGGSLLRIGGVSDHVHIMARLKADTPVSDVVKNIKGKSSRWLGQRPETRDRFSWQTGYGAFSVSESRVSSVGRYIEMQEQHHQQWTYKEELVSLLQRHSIEFDERYLFD